MKKIIFLYFACLGISQAQNTLIKGFQNPPLDAKPKALWDWVNGNYNYPQIKSELESAKLVGMGGFDIWDVGTIESKTNPANIGGKFLGDASADAIAYAIREAGNCGLEIGLVTSSSWNAGGDWMSLQDAGKGIYKSDTTIIGGGNVTMQLPLPKLNKPSSVMASELVAFPYSPLVDNILVLATDNDTKRKIDLTQLVDKNGRLLWKGPTGTWKIERFVSATSGEMLKVPSVNSIALMLDHFSAEAQEKNLGYILNKLTIRLGKDLGNTALKYLYVDSYEVSGSLWTAKYPQEFKNRRGYDMLPLLPALFDSTFLPQDSLQRFKFDVARTFSDMIIENHYLKGQNMCRPYGISYAAEAAGPGAPVHNCPFESLRSSGVLGYARGEFWISKGKDTLSSGDYKLDMIKGVASAAHIYGRKYVEAESFTTVDMYSEDFNEMKKALDNAFTWGLNRVVFHTFQHNPVEAGSPGYNYPFGTVFGTFQPWWKMVKGFNDYIARCSYMLQQGIFVADALYYYGDQAPNFVKETTLARKVGVGYDYDVINSEILIQRLNVKNGLLTLPHGQTFKLLVLPEGQSLSLEALKKIEILIKKGAIVLGQKPTKVQTLYNYPQQEGELNALAKNIWKNIDGVTNKESSYGLGKIIYGKSISEVFKQLNLSQDFKITPTSHSNNIRYIHRLSATGEDVYFVCNQSKEKIRFDATFRVGGKQAELWDAKTGLSKTLPYGLYNKSSTMLPLELEAYESVFVVFKPVIKMSPSIVEAKRDGQMIFPLGKRNTPLIDTGNVVEKTLSGAKNFKVNSKSINLSRDWEVRFPRTSTATPYQKYDSLVSWAASAEAGVKYFSGEATYYKTFAVTPADIEGKTSAILQLDSVYNLAEVWLNGINVGTLWSAPYSVDVTKALRTGENNLVIAVANGLNNRQVGDGVERHSRPFTYSNITSGGCAWCKPWKDVPLQKAGLIGKVNLKIWSR